MTASAESTDLSHALAKWNALSFAFVFASVTSALLFVATMFLVLRGGPNVGANLGLLNNYLPGYNVTFFGAFIGAFWSFIAAFSLAAPTAWLYYSGVVRQIEHHRMAVEDDSPTQHTARLSVPYFAAAFGLLMGATLFLATVLLVLLHTPGTELGPHLGLLSEYLPGYQVSYGGAAIGFAYLFVLGAVAFAAIAVLYNWLATGEPLPHAEE